MAELVRVLLLASRVTCDQAGHVRAFRQALACRGRTRIDNIFAFFTDGMDQPTLHAEVRRRRTSHPDTGKTAGHLAVVGVVGVLQLEVIEYRLKHEHGVDIAFESVAFQSARWARGEIPRAHWFDRYGGVMRLADPQRRPVLLLESEWAAPRIERDNASLRLLKASEPDAASGP